MATITPRSVATEFGVVLSGAGVSFDAPSDLPKSDGLIEAIWSALRALEPGMVPLAAYDEVRRRGNEVGFDIRMEQFLDVLSGPNAIPVSTVVKAYRMVGSHAYNANHLRLAALDADQFTVNMDTLIERAGGDTRVQHLHGTWDDEASIKTTVTQYVNGLAPKARRHFGRAIHGSKVLVIGYSGRDIDIMPIFDMYPPASITWVAPDADHLDTEANALRLRRLRAGLDFVPKAKRAGEYLPLLVPSSPAPDVHAERAPSVDMTQILRDETTQQQRALGIAALLNTLGLNEATENLLKGFSFFGSPEIRRRKLLARALARAGRHTEALDVLLPDGPSYRALIRIPSFLADIATIADRTYDEELVQRADRLLRLPWGNVRQRMRLARVRNAQDMAVDGDLDLSIRKFRSVTGLANATRKLGPGNLVNALTWHADALKTRGDIHAARDIAARANQLAPYADQSQRAYALWKRVEIDAIAGPHSNDNPADFRADMTAEFGDAIHFADRSGNSDAFAWLNGTLAEHLARTDVAAAQRTLRDAVRARRSATAGHGPAYLALQQGIVALAAGDGARAFAQVEEARTLATQFVNPVLKLQARQFCLHLRWLEGVNVAEDLDELSGEFARHKYHLSAARASAAAAMVRRVPVPQELLARAQHHGWDPADFGEGPTKWPSRERFYILV